MLLVDYNRYLAPDVSDRLRLLYDEHVREHGCPPERNHDCRICQDPPDAEPGCRVCRDERYVYDRPVTFENGVLVGGQSVPCEACYHIVQDERHDFLRRHLRIPEHWWEEFRLETLSGPKPRALVEAWVAQYRRGDGRKWLTLSGTVGTGKTHSAVGAAIRSVEEGQQSRYVSAVMLVDDIRDAIGENEVTERRRTYLRRELLIIDDLGAEHITPFVSAELYTVLSARHAERLPTIVTTNVTPESPETSTHDRLWSRVFDDRTGVLIRMTDADRRRLL